ncbi:hypothetical protein [Chamaesiphon sp. VAR_48_metabat_403]|nr:hypothetical protein [Chamaesiphon sp. VAR_48_metabat_403]
MPTTLTDASCKPEVTPNCNLERSVTNLTNRYLSKSLYYLWFTTGN